LTRFSFKAEAVWTMIFSFGLAFLGLLVFLMTMLSRYLKS